MSRGMTTNWAAAAVLVATLATSARAADLAAVPQRFVPVINWTGFYVGGHTGGAFGEDATAAALGTPVTLWTNPSGVIGGVQVGYNYRFSGGEAWLRSLATQDGRSLLWGFNCVGLLARIGRVTTWRVRDVLVPLAQVQTGLAGIVYAGVPFRSCVRPQPSAPSGQQT
jgi:hypothetical protein